MSQMDTTVQLYGQLIVDDIAAGSVSNWLYPRKEAGAAAKLKRGRK